MLPENVITRVHSCQDLVQCAFNLNQFEVKVYNELNARGPTRADDLADIIGKDRSTVYRALQKMMVCGMCFRETRSLPKGGYFHVYRAISQDELKQKLQGCVDDWYGKMQEVLGRFGEHA